MDINLVLNALLLNNSKSAPTLELVALPITRIEKSGCLVSEYKGKRVFIRGNVVNQALNGGGCRLVESVILDSVTRKLEEIYFLEACSSYQNINSIWIIV